MTLGQMRTGSMDNRGAVTVYTLERYMHDEWQQFQPGRRDTGEPVMTYHNAHQSKDIAPLANAFSASGDCWQRYGIHGTLDENIAMQCAIACRKNMDCEIRVMKRVYRVEAQVLLTTNGTSQNAD